MSDYPQVNGYDVDLLRMGFYQLIDEAMKLRTAVRKHRDSSGHDLCWYVPELWLTLPEKKVPSPEVPGWCEFIQKCAEYRKSLDTLTTDPSTSPRASSVTTAEQAHTSSSS